MFSLILSLVTVGLKLLKLRCSYMPEYTYTISRGNDEVFYKIDNLKRFEKELP
jgi:hypothetical protein